MRHSLSRALTLIAGALAVCLSAGAVRAETILSITQTAYDANDRPVCSAVRMNLATTATDACVLGTADTVNNWGPDRITRTVYDADGNVVEVKRAAGTTAEQLYATYTYTKNGQKASEADANGNVTRLVYDGFDRLETIYYPSPAVNHAVSLPCAATTETWCGGTQPYTVRITDTIGKPLLGVASTTDYERFAYDKNGNKASWRRRNVQTKYYVYDSLNRQVRESGSAGSVGPNVYTSYDLQGHVCDKISTTDTASSGNDCTARMTAVTTAGIHNSYDKAGRLLSTKDASARVVSYTYNEASQRTSMTYPDLVVEGYQYNVDGSLKWAGVNATTLGMTAGYDARGRLVTVTRSNGANSTVGYDDMSRVLTLKHTVTNTAYNADWAFIYNPASQVTKVTAPAIYEYVETVTGGYHPTYDGLNRDTGIANLTTTCGVDGDGYDCNGNLTNEGVGGRKFTYDIDNRLLTSTGGSALASLAYDPMGRLSSYTAGSLTTQFLYDGVNLIAEYQGGVMVKRYMHTTGTDQPFMEFTGTGTAPGNAKFLLANYQGSIIALADSTGTVNLADVYKYGPYGEPVNNASTTTWGGERFRYTGQIVLPEAQLYYYKARVYDPKYGRFLQTDPVGSKDDLDLYAYVGGDPINGTDPTGTQVYVGPLTKNSKEDIAQGKAVINFVADETPVIGEFKSANEFMENPSLGAAIVGLAGILPLGKRIGDFLPQSFFRGSKGDVLPDFKAKPGEFRLDGDGNVKSTHGVSVFDNPGSVRDKGFTPNKIDQSTIPDSLQIIQRGNDKAHFEITPKPGTKMTPDQFQKSLDCIQCRK